MRVAVLRYPGSNADWDALSTLRDVVGFAAQYVSHQTPSLAEFGAAIVPGGFSYGDYLRPGALARLSPVSRALREFAASGGPVLGICNGFQILTELGLLPGTLMRNACLRFECRSVRLRTESTRGVFSRALQLHQALALPIAHADGRYCCDAHTLERLNRRNQVAFRYVDASGQPASAYPDNPNGSIAAIAGIYNAQGNVLGLMPHPERWSEAVLGGSDGRVLFDALKTHLGVGSEGAGAC